MDQLSYYAHLTADAKVWTGHISPLSKQYVGHVDVYNYILPPVGFGIKDFIIACFQAKKSRFEIPCCEPKCDKATGISIFSNFIGNPNEVYCHSCTERLMMEDCA